MSTDHHCMTDSDLQGLRRRAATAIKRLCKMHMDPEKVAALVTDLLVAREALTTCVLDETVAAKQGSAWMLERLRQLEDQARRAVEARLKGKETTR